MGNRLFNNNNMPTSNIKEAKSVNNYSKNSSQSNAKTMEAFHDVMNADDHGLVNNLDNIEIPSQEGESMGESSSTANVNESEKLTDFEQMIDALRENDVKTINNIKEFENVLGSFNTIENNNDNIIDLDEIYEYLELGTDTDDVNLLDDPEILNTNEVNSKTSDNSVELSIGGVPIKENLSIQQKDSTSKLNIDGQENNNNDSHDNIDNIQNGVTVDKPTNDSNEISKKNVKVKIASDVPVHKIGEKFTGEVSTDDSNKMQETDNKILHTHIADDSKANSLITTDEMNNNDAKLEDFNEKSKENDDTINTEASLSNNPVKHISNDMESEADIIILSSDEEIETYVDEENDGYHSSDFEFITEQEANLDGFIINFGRENLNNSKLYNDSNENYNNPNDNSQRNQEDGNLEDSLEGRNLRNYRENHVIPEGDDYLNLFQGPLNPVMPLIDIIYMENKSIRPSPMNVQYEGMGFDNQLIARRHRRDSSEEEYADEAKENIKMILSLYPDQNKGVRKRRRHR